MKPFHSLKSVLSLLALGCALIATNPARANETYLIDINTSALVGNSAGPFSLDFQSIWGSGAAQTVTLSNFSFTGGSFTGAATIIGDVTGDLGSALVFNPNSGSFLNEFFQTFEAGVTSIRFNLDLTTNAAGDTPTSFVASILDGDLFNITTTGVGDSLVLFNVGGNTSFQSAEGNGRFSGVTATVPELSSTLVLLGVGLVAIGFICRGRRSSRHLYA